MSWLQIFLLSIIEGLTEFLPISSTGHMIIASSVMGIQENQFVQNFEIIIQFSAIFAVVIIYWKKFISNFGLLKKISVAVFPFLVIGFLLKSKVEVLLSNTELVAWALVAGGFIFLIFERYFPDEKLTKTIETFTYVDCVKLGILQSLALIPGTSRSGATIIGGIVLGLNRKEAAEFSFFLAVPSLAVITLYKSIKIFPTIQSEQISALTVGSIISFLVAFASIKLFIAFISKYGFRFFGWYRIILGCIVLIFIEIQNRRMRTE